MSPGWRHTMLKINMEAIGLANRYIAEDIIPESFGSDAIV